MTEQKTVLVVPWWKKERMLNKGSGAAVITPYEHVPCVQADVILMDAELKHEWDERMDDWFHGTLLHRMAPSGTYVAWCSETDPKNMAPDAQA